jgi:hypothetical protein
MTDNLGVTTYGYDGLYRVIGITAPFTTLTVKRISFRNLRWAIGSAVAGLDACTRIKLVW